MKRSTHLMKSGPSGLGQSTREVRVGTFGSRSIPDGENRRYSFTVEQGGSVEKLGEAAGVTIDGNTVQGKVWGPGGFDNFRVSGKIISANLPPELAFQDAAVQSANGGSNGSTANGSTENGDTSGGSNGGGNGGSGGGGSTGGGQAQVTETQQAGVSTTTLFIGGGILAAAGVAAVAMMSGGDGQSGQ